MPIKGGSYPKPLLSLRATIRLNTMRMRTLVVVVAGLLLAAGVAPALADQVPLLDSVTASTNPGKFLWNFTSTINVGQRLSPLGAIPGPGATPQDDTRSIKDYLTLYDFGGFTGTVILGDPTRFAVASYTLGSTPVLTTPPDLPGFMNITIYRIPETPNCCAFTGAYTFSIESVLGRARSAQGFFAADATANAPGLPADNTGVSNVGRVEVPAEPIVDGGCNFDPALCVPEPGTVLLMGSGLIALGIYRGRQG